MKKLMLGLLAVALTGAALPQAHAGDREWSTAGKILTGLFAAQVIARAVEPAPVYVQPAVSYSCAPAPVVVQSAPVYVQPATQYVVAQPPPVYYVQAAPVVVRPAPVVSYYYGPGYPYGYGYRGRVVYGHRPGCW